MRYYWKELLVNFFKLDIHIWMPKKNFGCHQKVFKFLKPVVKKFNTNIKYLAINATENNFYWCKSAFLQINKIDQEIFVETPKEAGENGNIIWK